MGSEAPRHRTDQVCPGDHTSDGEEARLPKRDLAHQPHGGERRVDRGCVHCGVSRKHLHMLQLDVAVERQTAVVEKWVTAPRHADERLAEHCALDQLLRHPPEGADGTGALSTCRTSL